jgi:tRNA 2-selenouridine synthase
MVVKRITADQALARWTEFNAIVDARSESEYAQDHLPGAVNWPTLNDAQRHEVGSTYKQISAFDARKRGGVLAARNIANHLEREGPALARTWKPLVYCWRGGQRSGALATVLDAVGFATHVLEGGYVAFRRAVLRELQTQPGGLSFRVLCGRTGSAKSRLLQTLAAQGAQVLDLEALACHKGSVLGLAPGDVQPTQKAFETALWYELMKLDPQRPVWAESESRTIGRLRIPEALLLRLRAAPCVQVDMPTPARVAFLLQDYGYFVHDTAGFCERLGALRELRGADTVTGWQQGARQGEHERVVTELLEQHYDPVYLRSMARNYAQFSQALQLPLPGGDEHTLGAAAARLQAHDFPNACANPDPAASPSPLAVVPARPATAA